MMTGMSAKSRLSEILMGHAARRLRRDRSDWAEAMMSEAAHMGSEDERLRWSSGCACASYKTPEAVEAITYPALLILGVALLSAYQWAADESLGTVAVICMIGVVLGVLQPRRSLISGAAIGVVVAAVNGFETLTGLRPTYEIHLHSFLHDAKWTVFVAPAIVACIVGRHLGEVIRSNPEAAS